MIRLFSVEEATDTILRRRRATPALSASQRAGMRRLFGEALDAPEAVSRILTDVEARGDDAVREWTRRLDDVDLPDCRVPATALAAAAARLDPALSAALRQAADRIRAFHRRQPLPSWETSDLGGRLGQRLTPLDRVGVYVPGGSAPLPSSLLMSVIPAQVAGVPTVVVATPPGRPDGAVPDVILAAAHLCGLETVYRIGGAQAIAALAYGTRQVPRVDKIVGAGNLFVTLAKQQLFGQVGLDGLFGPTETVVVADAEAAPDFVAADLLAQAEHDPLATAVLLTPSRVLAEAVQTAMARQLESRERAEIIVAALRDRGGIVLTRDLAEAVALADAFAPEHLCLSVAEPDRWVDSLRHAGGLFLGERSFEVLGDYVAGPSHIMPTGGTARFASPLNALDFVRLTSVIALDEVTAARLSPIAERLALAEQLDGHAAAAALRASGSAGETTASDAQSPTRPHIRAIRPYQPIVPFEVLSRDLGRPPDEIVKLDANENPFGPSPRAVAAAREALWHIYPDPASRFLREALAAFTGVPVDLLLAGAGADELIDLVLRAVLEQGEAVFDCPPSFGMYPFSTAVNAGRLIEVPRRADFRLDLPALREAIANEPRSRALFLCSPNNPTGDAIPDEELEDLLRLPLLIILDEAYVEFADRPSRIEWVPQHDNLIVLRTFSKWAGLAGLRVGYGAFPATLIGDLWKIKQPYNVNVAAQQAALASLQDLDWLWQNVRALKAERERLFAALDRLPTLYPAPSQGNFILSRVAGGQALALKQHLAGLGILVRHFDTPALRDALRISVGRPEQNDALLDALSAWTPA